jgi:hypothetical protein
MRPFLSQRKRGALLGFAAMVFVVPVACTLLEPAESEFVKSAPPAQPPPGVTVLAQNLPDPRELAVGASGVFWTDDAGVHAMAKDGTGATVLVATSTAQAVAVDDAQSKLYWLDVPANGMGHAMQTNLPEGGTSASSLAVAVTGDDRLAVSSPLFFFTVGSQPGVYISDGGAPTMLSWADAQPGAQKLSVAADPQQVAWIAAQTDEVWALGLRTPDASVHSHAYSAATAFAAIASAPGLDVLAGQQALWQLPRADGGGLPVLEPGAAFAGVASHLVTDGNCSYLTTDESAGPGAVFVACGDAGAMTPLVADSTFTANATAIALDPNLAVYWIQKSSGRIVKLDLTHD